MPLFYLLIATMPYIRHPIWDHQLGAGMTVTKAIGGACLLYALVYMPHRRGGPPRYFATPQSKLMMTFFFIAAISFFTKGQAIGYINPMFMYASTVLMFFLTLTVIDSYSRLYWSLMVAIGSVGFASLYMIREWQHGVLVWGGGFRPGWIVGDSNYFTVAALVTLPIAFELILISKRKWQRVYAIGCLGLTLMAITLGASRGGFLGIMVNLVYLVMRAPQARPQHCGSSWRWLCLSCCSRPTRPSTACCIRWPAIRSRCSSTSWDGKPASTWWRTIRFGRRTGQLQGGGRRL